jgi:predicted enzyme related to lactoylglutathione lyase
VDEDRGGGVGDGVQQRQRCVGLLWRGEAVGGKADAGGASDNGLPGELGLAVALQGLRSRRPPAELGWQLRGCFLPGGDDGEGIAGREGLEADGARQRHQRPVDGQAASTLIGIVVPRIDIEGGLPRELKAPAFALPAGPRSSAGGSFHAGPRGYIDPRRRRGKDGTMGNPVVHFEVTGKDPEKLRSFFGALFEWEFDTSAPVAPVISEPGNYGFVDGNQTKDGTGIPGGVGGGAGYGGHAVFYVGVPDVEAALQKAESLGGKRAMGPEVNEGAGLAIGHFTDPEGHLIGVAGPA